MWLTALVTALAAAAPATAPPEVLSVRYGDHVRIGSRDRAALIVLARDPDARIVAVTVSDRGVADHADGFCEPRDRPAGEVERWVFPVGHRLRSRSAHRTLQVTVESMSCDGGTHGLESATSSVDVWVPEPFRRIVTVPDLHGRPESTANCKLMSRGLRWRIGADRVRAERVCDTSSAVSPDPAVQRQSPPAGTRVRRGTVVRLEDECSLLRFEPRGVACA
jgi:hypothetical protein